MDVFPQSLSSIIGHLPSNDGLLLSLDKIESLKLTNCWLCGWWVVLVVVGGGVVKSYLCKTQLSLCCVELGFKAFITLTFQKHSDSNAPSSLSSCIR